MSAPNPVGDLLFTLIEFRSKCGTGFLKQCAGLLDNLLHLLGSLSHSNCGSVAGVGVPISGVATLASLDGSTSNRERPEFRQSRYSRFVADLDSADAVKGASAVIFWVALRSQQSPSLRTVCRC
jgi:hypothetical protein